MRAKVLGIAELRVSLQEGIVRQRAQLVAALDVLGTQMVEDIRAAAPKRTGALAASVRHEVVETPDGVRLRIFVGNEAVDYAPYVEFGTAWEPVHAFVRPVVYREEARIPGRVEHTLSTSWESS